MVKSPACQCKRQKEHGFDPWVGKIPGGGNGNPLQYSCLGNSMDRGAWWAIVHLVAESDMAERLSTQGHTHTQALILLTSFSFGHMMSVAHFSGVYHPLSPASRENTENS